MHDAVDAPVAEQPRAEVRSVVGPPREPLDELRLALAVDVARISHQTPTGSVTRSPAAESRLRWFVVRRGCCILTCVHYMYNRSDRVSDSPAPGGDGGKGCRIWTPGDQAINFF